MYRNEPHFLRRPGGAFFPIVAFLAFAAAAFALDFWYLTLLWGWFAVPLGAPVATWQQIAGLRVLIGFMCEALKAHHGADAREHDDSREVWIEFGARALGRALIVFVAWLAFT